MLNVSNALASLGADPRPGEMLFLDMPAARRMKLDADACTGVLVESNAAIRSLREALSS